GAHHAHVIDPGSGLGVTARRITCVRGPRGIDTDALATAGLVLDDEAWQSALRQVGCSGQVALVNGRSP
ncbi:MAG: hypothetical protein KDC98_14845, partial [Planctomycetes bacterium]|nr:hypothetical protein [Planctomycetota bacterium]